jgi:hypothetical protein
MSENEKANPAHNQTPTEGEPTNDSATNDRAAMERGEDLQPTWSEILPALLEAHRQEGLGRVYAEAEADIELQEAFQQMAAAADRHNRILPVFEARRVSRDAWAAKSDQQQTRINALQEDVRHWRSLLHIYLDQAQQRGQQTHAPDLDRQGEAGQMTYANWMHPCGKCHAAGDCLCNEGCEEE